MDITHTLIILAVGLVAGFFNTIAGGGSLLSLPILIFLGLPPSVANATNRVAIFSQNIFAVAGFKSKGISNFRYGIVLGISALIGAVIGAKIAIEIRGDLFNKILAIVMIMVVVLTIFKKKNESDTESEFMYVKRKWLGAIVFFFIGIYGGFIQAGVGFLIIGALQAIHHFSLVKTNSIKVFVVLIYTTAALGLFIIEGQVNWLYGIILAIGNSTGAWFTSRWSVKKGDKVVQAVLVVAVTILAIKLWWF